MLVDIPTFLKKPQPVFNLGSIPNPKEFSQRSVLYYKEDGLVRGLDLARLNEDLLDVPPQFHPAIRMGFNYCMTAGLRPTKLDLHANQGELKPGQNFANDLIHFDKGIEEYRANPTGEHEMMMIVSDEPSCLTRFYNQSFDLPDVLVPDDQDEREQLVSIFKAQADPVRAYTPKPYDLMAYSPYVVHQAQLPNTPVVRTRLMLWFS